MSGGQLDATDLHMARVAVEFYRRACVLSRRDVPPAADRLAGHLDLLLSDNGQLSVAAQQEWLTTGQIAERLGCSPRQAQRIATKHGTRFGRQLLTRLAALTSQGDT